MPYPVAAVRGKNFIQAVNYLLHDEFTNTEGAPIASPHICLPGPGNLTVVQNDGQFSTASGRLLVPGQTSPAYGDQNVYDAVGRARTPGLSMLCKFLFNEVTSECMLGWHTAGTGLTPENTVYIYATGGGNCARRLH